MATVRKKRHHYLPESYLAGFTPSGRKRDFLLAFDLRTKQVRRAKPKTVAFEKDLYAVSLPTLSRDAFEVLLADTQDDRASSALQRVCGTGRLLEADVGVLLDFMSLLCVRSPRSRLELNLWVRHQTGTDLDQAVENPDAWHWLSEYLDRTQPNPEYLRLIAQALTESSPETFEYSGLSAGDVVAGVSRNLTSTGAKSQFWHVSVMWPRYQMLAAELSKKTWSLCLSYGGSSFICSDSPVGAAWPSDCVIERDAKYSDEDSLVTFPLDRHSAIVAGLDGDHCESRCISEAAVAEVNSQTMRRATRFLFASSTDFPFVLPNGVVGYGRHVFRLLNTEGGRSST